MKKSCQAPRADLTQPSSFAFGLDAVPKLPRNLKELALLASGIGHDLNNQLGGILGYLEMTRDALEAGRGEKASGYLTKTSRALERIQALAGHLQDLSRDRTAEREACALEPLLREAASFALSDSNVQARYAIQPALWPGMIDYCQIGQVFDNLIINARQAMEDDGTLTIRAENIPSPPAGRPMVRISFTDTGCGIAPQELGRIFDLSFTTKHHGSGIGLANAASIVRAHGGSIEVQSAPGAGSAFHLYLPAAAQAEQKCAVGKARC